MKSRSAKNKGKRLQNEVCEQILKLYPELEPDDCTSAIMGQAGTDVKLSPAARKKFPYSVECKNTERIQIWDALKQPEDNTKPGTTPLVVFKRNRSITYAVLPFEEFLKLQKGGKHEVVKDDSDNDGSIVTSDDTDCPTTRFDRA